MRIVTVPALVVAPSKDPCSDLEVFRSMAQPRGAPMIDFGAAGHVNAASGLGGWKVDVLTAFEAGLSRRGTARD